MERHLAARSYVGEYNEHWLKWPLFDFPSTDGTNNRGKSFSTPPPTGSSRPSTTYGETICRGTSILTLEGEDYEPVPR